MDDVYRGFDRTLNRRVAIKVLPIELARQPEFVVRFSVEVSAVARWMHPDVIPIHYIGEDTGREKSHRTACAVPLAKPDIVLPLCVFRIRGSYRIPSEVSQTWYLGTRRSRFGLGSCSLMRYRPIQL